MNILGTAALEHKSITWAIILVILVGGSFSFDRLSRLEDPALVLPIAKIVTEYPGASPLEVEEEVTLPLEQVVLQLPYVDFIESTSSQGISQIKLILKSATEGDQVPQIWDEMRRKIRSAESHLPWGALPPQIMDDAADVFGVYMALTGPSYDFEELENYADFLQRELTLVPGVGRVVVAGRRQEQVFIEIDRARLAASGLSPYDIERVMLAQNSVHPAGSIRIADQYMRISPERRDADSLTALSDILIGGGGEELVYLNDIARVSRGFASPPAVIQRHNGEDAITLGISFMRGINVVDVGDAIDTKLADIRHQQPVGMSLSTIYNQPEEVKSQVVNFERSLLLALVIVTLVILLSMGWRLGIVISSTLLLTVLTTFGVMLIFGIQLHRISLGALIIALGMLVDNSIVVAEGVTRAIRQGAGLSQAMQHTITRTRMPLLMATLIAILAFAPVGLSPDMTGQWMIDLFRVAFISLLASWIIAIVLTPFFCDLLFKGVSDLQRTVGRSSTGVPGRCYRFLLNLSLANRSVSVVLLLLILVASVLGFGQVKQSFFPLSSTSTFVVRYALPAGSDINAVSEDVRVLEQKILDYEAVKGVTASIGQGHLWFTMSYEPIVSTPAEAELVIRYHSLDSMAPLVASLKRMIQEEFPQARSQVVQLQVGPTLDYRLDARITGPDPDVLRQHADRIMNLLDDNPKVTDLHQNWAARNLVMHPLYNDAKGARLGIGVRDLERAIAWNLNGQQVGLFRDGSRMLPILIRAPESERQSTDALQRIQVYSPVVQAYVNISQVVDGIELRWEDPLINRYNRKRALSVLFNSQGTTAADLHTEIRHSVEALELPLGYTMEWGAEYEDRRWANERLLQYVPFGSLVMLVFTMFILGSLSRTILVWLTVPFSLCGITIGLLATNSPFSFTAFLALISLVGMQLRAGIILMEEIVYVRQQGEDWNTAIVQGAVNRFRPVMMASITTILGMIPLLWDVFFQPMAVCFMFGLGCATVITLIALPVMMAIVYDQNRSSSGIRPAYSGSS